MLGHLPLRLLCPVAPAELIDQSLETSAREEAKQGEPPPGDAGIQPPYWADIWPAAVALGRRLLTMPLAGERVLEIGAGVGLAGLAAARAGASVLLTDREPIALEIVRRNAALNDLSVETAILDWFENPPEASFDWIIGADILYERQQAEPVARLLARLLDGGGRALIADPERPFQDLFLQTLAGLKLSATPRPTHFYWDGMARTVTLIEVEPVQGRES